MNITELSSRVTRQAPNCPGGVGNFGFNSYDLMTFGLLAMGAVSSAVIINTNKNENNNNNNDLQASIGGLTTNVQMSSADQTTTQMATITVPPTGVPGKTKWARKFRKVQGKKFVKSNKSKIFS